MQLYIRRNGEQFGPYSREVVIEYLKQDIFRDQDEACYAGTPHWKPLREILGVSANRPLGRGIELAQTRKITAFNPSWTQSLPDSHAPREPRFNPGLIAVGILSGVLVLGIIGIRLSGSTDRVRDYFAGLAAQSSGASGVTATPTPIPKVSVGPPPMLVTIASPIPKPVVASATPAAPSATPWEVAAFTPLPSATPAATPEVTPSAIPSATPEVTPSATPEATASPTPHSQPTLAAPKPFSIAALAADRDSWPKIIHLTQRVVFSVYLHGQLIGSVTAPIGSEVTLMNIHGGDLTVNYKEITRIISWNLTDIEHRVGISTPAPLLTPVPPSDGGMPIPPH